MKNGKIAKKPKKVRITAYVSPALDRAAVKFMARDENIKRYRRGKMSQLVSDSMKDFMRYPCDFKCPICGVSIRETDKYCFECGASVKRK